MADSRIPGSARQRCSWILNPRIGACCRDCLVATSAR